MTILTLNAGSSSLKWRVFDLDKDVTEMGGGTVSGLGTRPLLRISGENERELAQDTYIDTTIALVLDHVGPQTVVAHRIVHGGERYTEACELDAAAMDYLHGLEDLAPLHQPHNLAPVSILASRYPGLRQFGCFDTAFHAGLPPLASAFALPESVRNRGIRRYGFHGLSYSWIAHKVAADLPHLARGGIVAAHLGSGASLCAMKALKSVDTSMGLTALDGLPMGTRCGALDPGAVLALQRRLNFSAEAVEDLLYTESGLKGLSGISGDAEVLMASADPRARFALDYFVHRTAQQIAAMTVSLEGLDAVIFTGGIGENAGGLRDSIVAALDWMPPFEVHVVAADEARVMAMEIVRRL